jgi:hypothetical protein
LAASAALLRTNNDPFPASTRVESYNTRTPSSTFATAVTTAEDHNGSKRKQQLAIAAVTVAKEENGADCKDKQNYRKPPTNPTLPPNKTTTTPKHPTSSAPTKATF